MHARWLIAVPMALSGCGGSSSSSGPATPPSPSTSSAEASRDALVAAVKAYGRELGAGQGAAAYAQLSQRCKDSISRNDYVSIAAQLQHVLKGGRISKVTITTFAPPLARVSYKPDGVRDPAANKTNQPWTFEHGAWRFDACAG